MAQLVIFNKPFNVLSQFTDNSDRKTLANYIGIQNVYAAGRLDYDSEGLLLLTDSGAIQHKICDPKHKLPKTYWVQVEGVPDEDALATLAKGVQLKDGITAPAKAKLIAEPANLWERVPPIRERKSIATSWVSLTITEGKNRQVRRMTAAVGHPTLRLIRYSIGQWSLENLKPGEFTSTSINAPTPTKRPPPNRGSNRSNSSKNRAHPSKKRNKFEPTTIKK